MAAVFCTPFPLITVPVKIDDDGVWAALTSAALFLTCVGFSRPDTEE